jgi:hypothetical protein
LLVRAKGVRPWVYALKQLKTGKLEEFENNFFSGLLKPMAQAGFEPATLGL